MSDKPFELFFPVQIEDPDQWHAMVRRMPDEEKVQLIAAYVGGEFEKILGGSPLYCPVGMDAWVKEVHVNNFVIRNPG